jgi:hypothetical protein
MENLAIDELSKQFMEDFSNHYEEPEFSEADIVEFKMGYHQSESLHENYVSEIDAWARQALASNGFGDY